MEDKQKSNFHFLLRDTAFIFGILYMLAYFFGGTYTIIANKLSGLTKSCIPDIPIHETLMYGGMILFMVLFIIWNIYIYYYLTRLPLPKRLKNPDFLQMSNNIFAIIILSTIVISLVAWISSIFSRNRHPPVDYMELKTTPNISYSKDLFYMGIKDKFMIFRDEKTGNVIMISKDEVNYIKFK